MAITHARHDNIYRAIEELGSLLEYAKGITIDVNNNINGNILKEIEADMLQLIKSVSKLKIQLLINKVTVMVNKDKITESRGKELKLKLGEIKASIDHKTSSMKSRLITIFGSLLI